MLPTSHARAATLYVRTGQRRAAQWRPRHWLALGALLLAIGAVHLATLRTGHSWNGDFAQYVLHARNLVEGRPYAETGYLYNPLRPSLGPRQYPPGYPALLAPVYWLRGPALEAMKVQLVLVVAGALLCLALLLRPVLPPAPLLALVAMVGLHPLIWELKDEVLSDLPFMALTVACLLLAGRMAAVVGSGRAAAWAALTGACAYAATATRTIGVVLVVALLAHDALRQRRPGRRALVAVGVFALLLALQRVLLPGEGGYGAQLLDIAQGGRRLGEYPRALAFNLAAYGEDVVQLWLEGAAGWMGWPLGVAALGLAVAGFLTRLRPRPSLLEVFVPLYALTALAWPFYKPRYLLPLLPFYFFYLVLGARRAARATTLPVAPVLALALAALFAARYLALERGPFTDGVTSPAAVAAFAHIRSHSRPDDVFIFRKPRVLALYTGRRAAVFPEASDAEVLDYFARIGATHVLTGPDGMSPRLDRLVQRRPERFQHVYGNASFQLFRLRPAGLSGAAAGGGGGGAE